MSARNPKLTITGLLRNGQTYDPNTSEDRLEEHRRVNPTKLKADVHKFILDEFHANPELQMLSVEGVE